MLGRHFRFLQGEDLGQSVQYAPRRAVETGQPVTSLVRNSRKDGTAFIGELILSPLRDESGAVTDFLGF